MAGLILLYHSILFIDRKTEISPNNSPNNSPNKNPLRAIIQKPFEAPQIVFLYLRCLCN